MCRSCAYPALPHTGAASARSAATDVATASVQVQDEGRGRLSLGVRAALLLQNQALRIGYSQSINSNMSSGDPNGNSSRDKSACSDISRDGSAPVCAEEEHKNTLPASSNYNTQADNKSNVLISTNGSAVAGCTSSRVVCCRVCGKPLDGLAALTTTRRAPTNSTTSASAFDSAGSADEATNDSTTNMSSSVFASTQASDADKNNNSNNSSANATSTTANSANGTAANTAAAVAAPGTSSAAAANADAWLPITALTFTQVRIYSSTQRY